MKIKKVKISVERQLLIGMIVSTDFLKRVLPILNTKFFDIKQSSIVSDWITDYFSKHSQAPGKDIEDIFYSKAKHLNKGDRKWIEALLDSINKEYQKKGFNESYILEKTKRFFKSQNLKRNLSANERLLNKDRVEDAERVWINSRQIPDSFDMGFDPFSLKSVNAMFEAEESRIKGYFGIPALDRMSGPNKSGWLVMFMGPQKRGKTWTMQQVAVSKVLQGFNTVYITGEGEEPDHALRFWMNIGSLQEKDYGSRKKLEFPYFVNKKKSDEVKHRKLSRPAINRRNVRQAIRTFNNIGSGRLIVKVFPMGGFGLKEINNYLDALETYNNFTAENILVDYLGIMSAPPGKDGRDKYNENAMGLKAIAQERKAILYTGHQGRRETLEALSMGLTDIPEDVRLLGHVDVLVGINQTEVERMMGVIRYALMIHRHRKFSSKFQVKALQQLSAGQVLLDDTKVERPSKEDFDSEEEDDYEQFLPK